MRGITTHVSQTRCQVTNNYLDLAARVIHHTCMDDCFNIHERITLSFTDNMVVLWGQRKSLATSTSPPAHLLSLQEIHQQFQHYLPYQDFTNGVYNGIYDQPSRSQNLTDTIFLPHVGTLNPKELPWMLCTPPKRAKFCNSFRAVANKISQGLFARRSSAANGN